MRRRLKYLQFPLLATALCLIGSSQLRGQSAAPQSATADKSTTSLAPATSDIKPDLPRFDVSTVKPAAPSDSSMMRFTPDGIAINGVPLKMVIRESFGVEDDRILGEPGWVKNRYDIEAKVDPDDAPRLKNLKMEQRRGMLLPLLEDRFNLKYHHEKRELPMYMLVVAKGGLKMKASAPDDPPKADGAPKTDDSGAKDKPRMGRHSLMMNGRGHLESTGTTTEMLAHILAQQLGRTVENKTGLSGDYDYTLQWTPDDVGTPMGGDAGPGKSDISPDAGGPTLLTALEEQLGLKLESTKSTVDVIVIDRLDLPSGN
jgi:uncharacterized protein (TIGR03435 family)